MVSSKYVGLLMAASTLGCGGTVAKKSKCPPMEPAPERPTSPLQYNGFSWPRRCYEGNTDVEDFFLIGDYGGILCNHKFKMPYGGWSRGMQWACKRGRNGGMYVIPANNIKPGNDRGRVKTRRDENPQHRVAAAMQKHAAEKRPRFILNGGDNFYFGGLDIYCGTVPMDEIHERTAVQFEHVFEKMYSGDGLDDVPWFGILGNHDWGGMKFNAAWDQQIAYTWASKGTTNTSTGRWFLPALYWHQPIDFPDLNTTLDIFLMDTNNHDAKQLPLDKGHNICGLANDPRASCAKVGGPVNRQTCWQWFDRLKNEQRKWLDTKLGESKADWQIVVTHFPLQWGMDFWRKMSRKHGIDLFVGSHRHMQEVYGPGSNEMHWANVPWVVIGGGGGITSEWNPGWDQRGMRQYGFMTCTINKTNLDVKSWNEEGRLAQHINVPPRQGEGEPTCAHYGCGNGGTDTFQDWQACQCHADCIYGQNWNPRTKCCKDFKDTCPALASCEAYGCGSRYDGRKPCQCNKGCDKYNSCCSDYQEKCMSPEAVAAEEECKKPCEVEGQNGAYSCNDRVTYFLRHGKHVDEAISSVNEECEGQCTCDVKYFTKGSVSEKMESDLAPPEMPPALNEELPEEPAPLSGKKLELLEKKVLLEEELQDIEKKITPGTEERDPNEAYGDVQWGDHQLEVEVDASGNPQMRF